MNFIVEPDRSDYASILEGGLQDVFDDLRTIDLVDLISFIRFGSFATLEDLLQSSTELFFKEGTLTFAWTAGVDMEWGQLPTVKLGMEFRHSAVSVFFDLSLEAADQMVEISSVLFEHPFEDGAARRRYLSDAIADARLPKRPLVARAGRVQAHRDGRA